MEKVLGSVRSYSKKLFNKKHLKKFKELKFEQQDFIIFGIAMLAIFFAIFQIIQAQVRINRTDWPIYSNEEGNFSFRYPPEWGEPERRQFDFPDRPNYFYAVFPQKENVSFGGSLDGYEHPGRLVAPTDDPGFVKSSEDGLFYTPGNNAINRFIPSNELAIVEGGNDVKCLYNVESFDDSTSATFGIIRCNLNNEPFNGVNFVIPNPGENERDLNFLYEIISTFEKTTKS